MASQNLVDMILAARQGKNEGSNPLPPELLDRLRQTLMSRPEAGLEAPGQYAATGGGGGGPAQGELIREMARRQAAMQFQQRPAGGGSGGGEYGIGRINNSATTR